MHVIVYIVSFGDLHVYSYMDNLIVTMGTGACCLLDNIHPNPKG